MSKRNFDEDRRICDAVAKSPEMWECGDGTVFTFDYEEGEWVPLFDGEIHPEDARFIAEARTGWVAALDRIAELETVSLQLRKCLADVLSLIEDGLLVRDRLSVRIDDTLIRAREALG